MPVRPMCRVWECQEKSLDDVGGEDVGLSTYDHMECGTSMRPPVTTVGPSHGQLQGGAHGHSLQPLGIQALERGIKPRNSRPVACD